MMTIELHGKYGDGKVATVDEADYVFVSQWTWYLSGRGYVQATIKDPKGIGRNTKMHRLLLNCPTGVFVDHIDRDKLNNCRSNFRLVSPQQNQWNRDPLKGSSSAFKGVSWNKATGKWQAYIGVGHRQLHIGLFPSERGAAMAYDIAAHDLHGEYAYLNFPTGIHG